MTNGVARWGTHSVIIQAARRPAKFSRFLGRRIYPPLSCRSFSYFVLLRNIASCITHTSRTTKFLIRAWQEAIADSASAPCNRGRKRSPTSIFTDVAFILSYDVFARVSEKSHPYREDVAGQSRGLRPSRDRDGFRPRDRGENPRLYWRDNDNSVVTSTIALDQPTTAATPSDKSDLLTLKLPAKPLQRLWIGMIRLCLHILLGV